MRDSKSTMLSLKSSFSFFTLICGKHIGDTQALSCQCCLLACSLDQGTNKAILMTRVRYVP